MKCSLEKECFLQKCSWRLDLKCHYFIEKFTDKRNGIVLEPVKPSTMSGWGSALSETHSYMQRMMATWKKTEILLWRRKVRNRGKQQCTLSCILTYLGRLNPLFQNWVTRPTIGANFFLNVKYPMRILVNPLNLHNVSYSQEYMWTRH